MQHEVGAIVEGKVTGITKFGAFVELDGGGVGMVHISEIASTYVNDIADHLTDQQRVTVKVLNITDDGKISLSIKKASPQEVPPRREFKQGGGGQPPRQPRFNNNNSGGGNQRASSHGSTYRPPAPSKQPVTFDDMLSKFLQSSEEKTADMRREKGTRRSSAKRNRDYE